MRSRLLARWRGLILTSAIASLVLFPAVLAGETPTSVIDPGDTGFGPNTGTDEEDSIQRPTTYSRANYVWPFATGPRYGLFDVERSELRKPGMLHTQVGVFDLSRGTPDLPEALRANNRLGELGAQYFLVQLHPDALSDNGVGRLTQVIEAAGGRIVGTKPVAVFVALLNEDALVAAQSHSGVMGVIPYHPAFKINPLVGRIPLTDPYKAVSDVYSLDVRLFAEEPAAPVAEAIAKIGGNVRSISDGHLVVDIHRDGLAAVAALEPVARITEALPVFTKGEESATVMQTGDYNAGALPYHTAGVDGSGAGLVTPVTWGVGPNGEQLLMVLDTGIQLDAGDLSHSRTDPGEGFADSTHRKVQKYVTDVEGMNGDLLGCDATASGGVTHGHTVSATALGNATAVDEGTYGDNWTLEDPDNPGSFWDVDGVAPGARLVAYDAQETPNVLSCDDPGAGGLIVGDVYRRAFADGSLFDAYDEGARIANFSWGSEDAPVYGLNPERIDQFMFDFRDAVVFIAAGNEGQDTDPPVGVPDPGSVSTPATAKNAMVIGASRTANAVASDQRSRAPFSSVGPAVPADPSLRVAPIVMAPGDDFGANTGIDSEYHCRSTDNGQTAPVQCELALGQSGTSFASPAAAGAALLVRDYFYQGMYPDGSTTNLGNAADQQDFISGALMKAILIASTSWMDPDDGGFNLSERFRFNNEQGYGRIQLNNILPLSESVGASTPTGLIVADHNNDSPALTGPNNTTLSGSAQNDTLETYQFEVNSNQQELRIACAWIEDVPNGGDGMLDNNIDIELVAPDGTTTYFGNVFTEDKNRNDVLDALDDCDGDGVITEGAWSLAGTGVTGCTANGTGCELTCATANTFAHDNSNPTEAIMLSPDPEGDGIDDDPETAENEGADNMIQTGTYTLRVAGQLIVAPSPDFQLYSCAIGGPVALGSSVRFDKGGFVCNDEASVSVSELDPCAMGVNDGDLCVPPDTEELEIGRRTLIEVIDVDGVTVNDTEGCADDAGINTGGNAAPTNPCLVFTKPIANAFSYKLATPIVLTDGLLRAPNATWYNGVLDVRSGESLRVTYYDEDAVGGAGSRDAAQERFNTGGVGCDVSIGIGGFTWTQFGVDTAVLVDGGCERDARGLFTFGHPDRYMDADEKVGYRIVVQSTESNVDLTEAVATLRCVEADADSPANCQPGTPVTAACPDPDRTNNGPCETAGTPWLTILDSPKRIGLLPANNFVSINFAVEMAAEGDVPATQEIDMLLGLSAKSSGKGVEGVVASRQILEADEDALNYNTDFPMGGVENKDYVSDEVLENPITVPGGSVIGNDYRFETATWDNLQATGRNTLINIPWDFEGNDGGFIVGLHTATDLSITSTIINWGEDLNFNGLLDGGEDRDATGQTGSLDRNWNTRGGCGWQTNPDPFDINVPPGGVWHTGTIDITTLASCFGPDANRQCQAFETVGGGTGLRSWIELLKTPVIEKVNQCGPGRCNNGLSATTCEVEQDCLDQGDVGPCIATADPLCAGRRDEFGKPVFDVRFIDWGWNMSLDLPDSLVLMTWEFDTDLADTSQSNLDAFPVLNIVSGPQGPVAGGNAPITDGFQLFSATHFCSGNTQIPCSDDPDCEPPNVTPGVGPCIDAGSEVTGKRGLNRAGRNSCFFDGTTQLPTGLAKPIDNDQNRNGTCSGNASITCRTGNGDLDCTDAGTTGPCNAVGGVCVADSTFTNGEWVGGTPCDTDVDCQLAALSPRNCSAQDTYLTPAGPIRNMDIQKVNGPDMRLTTLEDIYGLSGSQFQGAIGMINDEGTIDTQPQIGFGIAIDDMFVSWSEVELTQDNTECDPTMGGGSCASVEIGQTRIFEGSTTVAITILDASPYDSANPGDLNDCNLDNTFDGTDDCNQNGIPDIVARATSESLDQEVLILDEVSTGVYAGQLSVSAAYDVDGDPNASPPIPGVLFLSASGTDNPAVIIQYTDRDDGTGNVCPNDTDPAVAGTVQATSTVFLTRGTIIVKGARIENSLVCVGPNDPVGCNGDGDAFADSDETAEMFLTLINKTGIDLNRVVARVNTADTDKIECILTPFVAVGPMAEDEELEVADPIIFKVADVNRVGVNDDFSATFDVTMSADEFDALLRTQDVTIPLDLDVLLNTGNPITFVEGFEGGTIAASAFESDEIDDLAGPDAADMLLQSDGFRCQYNDCEGPNPNGGPDNPNCPDAFMGFAPNTSDDNADDWHVHTTDDPDGGRAFVGNNSLHWGRHDASGLPDDDSSRLKSLEAVFTTNPINLDVAAIPELTFTHQISLMDFRGSNTPAGESVDRGVVHIQLADSAGNPAGVWEKAFPFENVYDVQGTDAFINNKFDPTDDGNNEDDYFDDSDPLRRLGPSSTCFPEFVYGAQGDTDWRNTFNSTEEGLARAEGPGLPGSIDRGTWVTTKFNLASLIGRRIRVRFLTTSIEVGDAVDHQAANITDPNDPEDDGWWIDEVTVTGALDAPVLLGVDNADNSAMPGCGNTCGTVNAALVADPAALPAPGQVTELSAADSDAPAGCTGGVLQYQFWTDEDLNGVIGDAADILLRDWTDNPTFLASPELTTNFGVRVRCSSDIDNLSCNDTVILQVPVTCPSAVAFKGADEPMTEKIRFAANKTDLEWNTVQFVDFVRGDLIALKAGGTFTGTVAACFANDANVNTLPSGATPAPGGATYYVGRGRSLALTACNEIGGYGSTGTDAVDRNAQINADVNACP